MPQVVAKVVGQSFINLTKYACELLALGADEGKLGSRNNWTLDSVEILGILATARGKFRISSL